MNRTILYYPTIDIPRKNWLKQAVLYWDEVSSIVPSDIDLNFSPDLQYLLEIGQFRPINPETLLNDGSNYLILEEFQNEFKNIIQSSDFQRFNNRTNTNQKNIEIHPSKIIPNLGLIHRNKTSENLFHFLEDLNLAKRSENDEWLNFEKNTALLYMSLLAKYIAEVDNEYTTIGTDYIAYEKFNFKTVRRNGGFPVVSFDLNNILPCPNENVSIDQIIKFKNRRIDNLRHFKKMISDFQTDISNSESNQEMKEKVINFQDSLINGVQDLKAVLDDSRLETTLKTFRSLIDLKSPTLITTIATSANHHLDYIHLPFDLSLIGIPIMASLELTTKFVENRNKRMAESRKSPFSYLYYAHKNNIISRR